MSRLMLRESARPIYAAVVDAMDQAIGQVLTTLDEEQISDETIDGTKVTYVTAEGTFMKGPPFGGNKVPVPNSGLLGASID